jgi:gamma-glutamylcyclotransferase (GGCT)/AIG2-like uncharacterized protein YtfP
MSDYLFVYGTLRKGDARAHRLLGAARFVSKGTVSGRLYDLGDYPGLRKTPRGGARVGGEVYELAGPDPERRLAILDRYEGAEFRRARVVVRLRDGRVHRAWAYVLANQPPKGTRPIPTGVYKKAGARRSRRARPSVRSQPAGDTRRG